METVQEVKEKFFLFQICSANTDIVNISGKQGKHVLKIDISFQLSIL